MRLHAACVAGLQPCLVATLFAGAPSCLLGADQGESPWEGLAVDVAPAMEAVDSRRVEGVHAIYFASERYQGKPTKVFAYYGLPEGATEQAPVPGIVCVHGGWGTAYPEWVRR